ncbi:MAG: alkaline phosphatase D family protein, partial [Planctomycetales bacterium]|nr:alkaline phosphatase D family protein [Planctomycetales bacterium]
MSRLLCCFIAILAAVAVTTGCRPSSPNTSQSAASIRAPMGIMIGEVTSTTALAQVRLSSSDELVDGDLPGADGVVEFSLHKLDASGEQPVAVQLVSAKAEHDYIARAEFRDLEPGTRYRCRSLIGLDRSQVVPGPMGEFRTYGGASAAEETRLVVVTGMNYAKFHGDQRIDRAQHVVENNRELPEAYAGADKALGYPGLAAIRKLQPDFFIGTGDNVYYDTPDTPRAEQVSELRKKWHEQFVQPRYRDLFWIVPTYWEIDDHDYRIDDGDNSGDYDPTPEVGRRMMLEQLPIGGMEDAETLTYRTHRISRDLQIWLVENRMYRSNNADPDGPKKSIWGAKQKKWLQDTLKASDATFKLLIWPTPMVGPDDLRKTDNHTNINGFRHERDEFFKWLGDEAI